MKWLALLSIIGCIVCVMMTRKVNAQLAVINSAGEMETIKTINHAINIGHRWCLDDPKNYHWRVLWPGLCGDCSDFVMTKREMLLSAGFPENRMHYIAFAVPGQKVDHLVLAVDLSSSQRMILDNRWDEILTWRDYYMQHVNGTWWEYEISKPGRRINRIGELKVYGPWHRM